MIRIYTAPSCASCRKVKSWLMKSIPYVERIFFYFIKESELRELLERSEMVRMILFPKKQNY